MSQWKVFAVALCVLLTAGVAVAQQQQQDTYGAQQRSQQPSAQQPSAQQPGAQQQGASGMGGQAQDTRSLGQAVDKQNVDVKKAIDKAKEQFEGGQVIGVAVVQPTPGGEMIETHVFILDNNQVQQVVLDAKGENVRDTRTRPMLSNPWQQAGADRMQQMRAGALSSDQAQRLASLSEQQKTDLKQAVDKAKEEVKDSRVVGAFIVLPEQVSQQARQPQAGAQPSPVFVKVFNLDQNGQLRVVTIDPKEHKVVHSESRQMLTSPWQSTGAAGMGGTQQPGQPSGQQPRQPGSYGGQSGSSGGQSGSSGGQSGSSGGQSGGSSY